VEGTKREELVRVAELVPRIAETLTVIQIVKKESGHDRIRSLWGEDFVRLEVRHALVGPRKGAIMDHRNRRSGGCNVRRHDTTLTSSDDGPPVLHALGQRVVRALCHADTVNQVVFSALTGHRLFGILSEALSAAQEV